MGTRREFLKKVGYAAPVVLTMTAKPSFASSGSDRQEKRGKSSKSTKKSNKKSTKSKPTKQKGKK